MMRHTAGPLRDRRCFFAAPRLHKHTLYGMLKAPNGAKQGSTPKLQKKEKDYGTYQSGDGRGRRYAG